MSTNPVIQELQPTWDGPSEISKGWLTGELSVPTSPHGSLGPNAIAILASSGVFAFPSDDARNLLSRCTEDQQGTNEEV